MSQPEATTAATTKNMNMVESVRVGATAPSPRKSVYGAESRNSRRIASQNNSNFEKSAPPSLIMYYHHGSWVNFSPDVVQKLRAGFLERRPIVEASIDGAKYIFDWKRMVQIDYSTGNQRSVSWIDENRKCFFPYVFFSEEEIAESDSGSGDNVSCNYKDNGNNRNPKIEIEVKIDGASSKRLREEPEVSSANKAVGLHVIKRQRVEEGSAARWPNSVLLRETVRTFVLVKDHFLNGMKKVDNGVTVTSIHKCKRESHLEKARFQVFQKQIEMTKVARGTPNIVYAWYGASAKVVESVLAHGFGKPSIVTSAELCGVGVHLSYFRLPELSAKLAVADDSGVKHLILCRLILGNVEKLEAGSKQCHPSSVNFDTGSDDPKNPNWFVVWSTKANMHILPEYVVSFRPSHNMQGQPRPVAGVRALEILLSKIKSSLPPAKLREIWIAFSSFKDGKLARDVFLRHLRLVAGDEVLKSAILEINASG